MNKSVYTVMTFALAMSCGSASFLRAEDAPQKAAPETGWSDSHHHGMMEGKWKEKLGLSDDQAEKLKAVMKAHREAMEPLHKQLKEDMKKLHEQIKNKAGDSDVEATLDQLSSDHKAMEAGHDKLINNLKFLTPTQRGKMLLGMMKHMHDRFGHEERHQEGKSGEPSLKDHGKEGGPGGEAPAVKDAPSNEPQPQEAE